MYARVNLSTLSAEPAALPSALRGLAPADLADLRWTDPDSDWHDQGFWPLRERYAPLATGQRHGAPSLAVDAQAGCVWQDWPAVLMTAEERQTAAQTLADDRQRAVEAELANRIAAGVTYSFPDGQTGTVQLRDARDQGNVQAVASAGNALVTLGDTSSSVAFRDQENVTHPLTGAEAVAFGLSVMNAIAALYAVAWAHKDALKALAEAGDLEGLDAYDPTSGWPD